MRFQNNLTCSRCFVSSCALWFSSFLWLWSLFNFNFYLINLDRLGHLVSIIYFTIYQLPICSTMQEINFSSYAYCKMMLHAAKYPQCAVNGVLLASIDENSDKTQPVTYVNAVPMFHLCLHVSPMAEIALSQIESWASSVGLTIAGYYLANENLNDVGIDKPAHKIADKINEKVRSSHLVVIDNRLVTLCHSVPSIKAFHNTDGKWRPLDKSKVLIDDSVLAKTSELLQRKSYYDLVDFDNHLDNISLDWKNTTLDDQIDDIEL